MRTILFILLLNQTLYSQQDTVWFQIENRTFEIGDTIYANFSIFNFDSIGAYQFGLRYDTNSVNLVGIDLFEPQPIPMANLGDTAFIELGDTLLFPECIKGNFGLCKNGEIRSVWTNPWSSTAEDNSQLFSLKFIALEDGNLSETLWLDQTILYSVAYTFYIDPIPLFIRFIDPPQHTTNTITDLLDPIRIYGNPYIESAIIELEGTHIFTAFNSMGIIVQQGIFTDQLEFFGNEPGIYYIKVDNRLVKIIKA